MGNAKVHLGFLDAYNAVALDVLHIVQDQLAVHPSYRIIVTGHSLGGAIAALGAISIKSAHPHVPIKLFTFGGCFCWSCVKRVINRHPRAAQGWKSFFCRLCRAIDRS